MLCCILSQQRQPSCDPLRPVGLFETFSCLLQAKASDLDGIAHSKAELDGSVFSKDTEVHTAYVRYSTVSQALKVYLKLYCAVGLAN